MTNLLPHYAERALRRVYVTRVAAVLLLALALTALIGIAELLPSYFYITTIHAAAERELELRMKDAEGEKANITEVFAKTNELLALLSDRGLDGIKASEDIAQALDARPSGISVEGLEFTKVPLENTGTILLSGTADTRADLINFLDALENTRGFNPPDIPASQLAESEGIEFTITVTFALTESIEAPKETP